MTPLPPPPRLPAHTALPALSVTPQARPGLFKRAIAWLLMLTINISAVGQAAAQIIRGPNGAPLTGYTANGTFVQNGVVVGNPHQQLHDMQNPSLWTTGAVSFINSTDPSFTQGTLAEIEAAIAVAPEPGGLALSRLYITVPPAVPLANPYTDPNAGAAGCNAATTCNQAVYNQLLLDAQASGYTATLDSTHIGKTHASSSPEIFDRGFNLYHTKPVFVAAENPAGGATAFFALQGEQAKTHLAHLQQQNAALLGSAIFFSQQRIRGPGTGATTDWEGNVNDPGAAFDAALGSAPSAPSQGQYSPTPAGNGNDFVVGYIKPDGQAHEFQLQHDQHFREFQRQQNYGGWDGGTNASASELDSLLGQNLRTAGTQHLKGEQAANSIDFRGFKEDRALFMQGLDLYRFASASERELLSRLQNGEIGPGHPQYAAARALAEDKFRGAYAGHVEYNTQFKHTKESAAYQAQQLDLKNIDNDKLFNQGLNLFDKRGDPEQERLLGMLQRGELKEDHPRYQEIRGLAEARFKVAYQKALEPPKKTSWLKQLVTVVIAAVVVYFTAGAASVWAAGYTGASLTAAGTVATTITTATTVGAVTTVSVAGVAATAIGSAIGAYAGAVVGAGIQTGSLSRALAAGENSLKGGVAGILVNTALAAAGVSAVDISSSMGMSQQVSQAVYNTISGSLTQSIAYGGSFGDALVNSAISNATTAVSAMGATAIAGANLGAVGTEIAHAGLGCAAGVARSGGSEGCGAGAVGAVVAHAGANWLDPAMGRTLSDSDVAFWGGLAGGTAAALVGGSNNVQANFGIGQTTGQNAVENNYLTTRQISDRDRALQAAKTPQEREEINRKFDQIDQQQSQDAFNCVVKGRCVSVLEPASIRAVLDDLNASCAPPRQCSPDALAGIREINSYYGQGQAIKPLYPVEEVVLGGALGGRLVGTSIDAISAAWAAARGRVAGELGANGGSGLGSAANGIYSDTRPMGTKFPELEGVNPHYVEGAGVGVNTNCVSCVNAAQSRLTGANPTAVAAPSSGYAGENALLPSAPFGLQPPSSVAAVTQQMTAAGDGAVGVVLIRQPNGVSHVINVVNQNGRVYFIDTQMQSIVTLQPNLTVQLGRP